MQRADRFEMRSQARHDTARQHGHAVLRALAVAHDDLAACEFNVLHSQANAFHDAHARAVQQPADQAVRAGKAIEHAGDFVAREDDRKVRRRLRELDAFQPGQLDGEDFLVEEE